MTSKLPNSTGIRLILNGWSKKFRVQPQNMVSIPTLLCVSNRIYPALCVSVSPILTLQLWAIPLEMTWCPTLETTISFGRCPIAPLSISNICVASTPAIVSKVPYLIALVGLLGARVIMVKLVLGVLGKISSIGFLLPSSHIVGLGYILLLERLLLVTMVVSG
ncbi:hypothetical protein Tco_0693216 [Tanacetum coccineum]